MQLIKKNPWHAIGVIVLIVAAGVVAGIRVANRPVAYFFEDTPLFQTPNKEMGLAQLDALLNGGHQISFIVSPGKTGSLIGEDIFVLGNTESTRAEKMVSLSPAFMEEVRTLIQATDPEKNTAGSINIEDGLLVSEPPTGDQIDTEALVHDLAKQALVRGAITEPVEINYSSSKEVRDRFEATTLILEELLEAPILLFRNNEQAGELTRQEIADLLVIAWPADPAIAINMTSYQASRFAKNEDGMAFDFSNPQELLFNTEALPLSPEELLEGLLKAGTSSKRQIDITLAEPALDIAGLHLISSFTTYYDCCQGRVTNIEQIAKIVDSTVVASQESLSVNTLVGERTEEKGFVPAGSILGGELVDSVGGGVSQFATTLYNAVYWAGLQDIRHQPHSWSFSRYPTGIEATISWPYPDLIFKNNTAHPVIIRTFTTDTSITAQIWGNNDGRTVVGSHKNGATTMKTTHEGGENARVVSSYTTPPYEELDSIPTLIYPNISTPRFSPKVVSTGTPGKVLNVFRTITTGENEHTDLWKVTYKPIPIEIHVHPCDLDPQDRVHRFEKYDYSWVEC